MKLFLNNSILEFGKYTSSVVILSLRYIIFPFIYYCKGIFKQVFY